MWATQLALSLRPPDGQSVPWIRLREWMGIRLVLSTSFVADLQILVGGRILINLNRSLWALVGSILAGRLEFFRHRVHFGMGLVVGPHFKNLGSHVRTN